MAEQFFYTFGILLLAFFIWGVMCELGEWKGGKRFSATLVLISSIGIAISAICWVWS